jgi:hypothetical protein
MKGVIEGQNHNIELMKMLRAKQTANAKLTNKELKQLEAETKRL